MALQAYGAMRMRIIRLAALAGVLLTTLGLSTSHAQWQPGGVRVCGPGNYPGQILLAVTDDTGGWYVAWWEGRNYPNSGFDVYLQRLTSSGVIAAGWPTTGIRIGLPRDDTPTALVADGMGGAIVVWQSGTPETNGDVYCQRVLGSGQVAPGWPDSGVPVSRALHDQWLSKAVADGEGGVYIVWRDDRDIYNGAGADVYAQHLLADGSIAPGWSENGLPVATGPAGGGLISLLRDDDGGVVILWTDFRRGVGDIYAQRLQPDGTLAPGWPVNGRLLVLGRGAQEVVPDGAGGFYAAYAIPGSIGYDGTYYVQRFTFEGAVAEGWPADGLLVCSAPDDRGDLRVAPDGLGGILMAWADYRLGPQEIFAARVLPNATHAPGWPANGAQVSGTTGRAWGEKHRIASDNAGGMYLVWEWYAGTFTVLGQHLTATGEIAPGWAPGGVDLAVGPAGVSHRNPNLTADGEGGMVVVWVRNHPAQSDFAVYAQHDPADYPVPALISLSLVRADATPQQVVLAWRASETEALRAQVERSSDGTNWSALGEPHYLNGELAYEDRDIVRGHRYGYRLSYRSAGTWLRTEAIWVEVPVHLDLALGGFQPNPAAGAPRIAFTLARAGPARIEVLDIAGRRVFARDVGALGTGLHTIHADGPLLKPGVYLIRLITANQMVHARGVITK